MLFDLWLTNIILYRKVIKSTVWTVRKLTSTENQTQLNNYLITIKSTLYKLWNFNKNIILCCIRHEDFVECERVLLPWFQYRLTWVPNFQDPLCVFQIIDIWQKRNLSDFLPAMNIPPCTISIPRPRASIDVGYEISFPSVLTPSSGKKGRTLQNTRMFPFSSYNIRLFSDIYVFAVNRKVVG